MKVNQTEETPIRPNTAIAGFDYVVIDGDKYVLSVTMNNSDKLRLGVYDNKPNPDLQRDASYIAHIDFKLATLTSSPVSRSPDLVATLMNFIGKEVDPNRSQYIQLRIHSDDVKSYKGANNADA